MIISIIILTYNRSSALLAVLSALCGQSDPNFEVIIADDGSRKEHIDALEGAKSPWPFSVQHVWHPDVGFTAASARNMGAAIARGSYLIFLDGDCVPLADFVERHRKLARKHCFVNGSRALLSERLTATALKEGVPPTHKDPGFWIHQRLLGDCNKLLGLFLRWPARLRLRGGNFRWRGIRSCNFALWRDDFERVNGFDESFDGWGHEDADLVLRLHRAGCRRINGFWATEVLHLWHDAASRNGEAANLKRVADRARMRSFGYEAAMGLRNPRDGAVRPRVRVLSR